MLLCVDWGVHAEVHDVHGLCTYIASFDPAVGAAGGSDVLTFTFCSPCDPSLALAGFTRRRVRLAVEE